MDMLSVRVIHPHGCRFRAQRSQGAHRIHQDHSGTCRTSLNSTNPSLLGKQNQGMGLEGPLLLSKRAARGQPSSPRGRGVVPGSPARLGESTDTSVAAGHSQSSWNLSTHSLCQFAVPERSGELRGGGSSVFRTHSPKHLLHGQCVINPS